MGQRRADQGRESLAQALVVLHRYSVDLTGIAAESLGRYILENRDIEMILAVQRLGPMTPTEMAVRMRAPRSAVSRAMARLEGTGLLVRIPDHRDGRRVRIVLTPKGRRRVGAFSARLADYFSHAEPLLKDAFDLVGVSVPDPDPTASVEPVAAAQAMSVAGAGYVEEVVHQLREFGISESPDRFTIALLDLLGGLRPTQIADELGLTPSGTSGVLTRLERVGLLTRRHDVTSGDRRAVLVELTPRGQRAADVQLDAFERHVPDLVPALLLARAAAS
jgi:DNA-binding MarR family transcriptional regulator